MQTTNWQNAYARLAGQLIGADPLIGREDLADRLAVPADDLDRILDHHPLAPILRRWQATKPGGWAMDERVNATSKPLFFLRARAWLAADGRVWPVESKHAFACPLIQGSSSCNNAVGLSRRNICFSVPTADGCRSTSASLDFVLRAPHGCRRENLANACGLLAGGAGRHRRADSAHAGKVERNRRLTGGRPYERIE